MVLVAVQDGLYKEGKPMTRYFLDSQEIAIPFDASTITQVLKHVEAVHLSPNTVVRQIQVDGLPLVPDPKEQFDLRCEIEKRDRIEIFTGTVRDIADNSISEALDYLDRVEAAIPSLSNTFQTSPNSEAFQHLRQLYEGLYWLNLLLDKLKANFQKDFEKAIVQGIPAAEQHQKFIAILKQLIESQERRDFGLISDLLQYEISPLVSVWREMFLILSKKVNATQ
jgi:hypothetical protein